MDGRIFGFRLRTSGNTPQLSLHYYNTHYNASHRKTGSVERNLQTMATFSNKQEPNVFCCSADIGISANNIDRDGQNSHPAGSCGTVMEG